MKKLGILGVLVVALGAVALGQGVSGSWTSGLTFGGHGVSLASSLTLHLAGPGWGLTTTLDPTLRGPSLHALTLQGRFGAWTVEAGASVLLPPPAARLNTPALGTTSGPIFQGGFVSFELALGNLTLRFTLHTGSGE